MQVCCVSLLKVGSEDKLKSKQALDYLRGNIFRSDFTCTFLHLLITRYITLSVEDLEMWDSEPESFVQDEEANHWEYNVRVRFL